MTAVIRRRARSIAECQRMTMRAIGTIAVSTRQETHCRADLRRNGKRCGRLQLPDRVRKTPERP
ncbi:hypothetical protein [Burkholderia humptydooensis]|uniref:hypothetical protein n=1 Tax=Burkholderia humptydooensis TaxID=430531 RepID=UPI0003F58BA9|nr:hypothetical protein [Burkholderia humptydooensis]